MKKVIVLLVALLLAASVACAENMETQITWLEGETQKPFRGTVELEQSTVISGYAELQPLAFGAQDALGHYFEGKTTVNSTSPGTNADYYYSGADAEYAILRMDITNLALTKKDFLERVDVRAIFDERYVYGGWAYQLNYNNGTEGSWGWDKMGYHNRQNTEFVIDAHDQFPMEPMYTGHYFFGCTLPNAIIESNKPLRFEIMLDDHKITYVARK